MERHEEQVNCFAHVAHARQAIAALQDAAAAYKAALLVSKQKHAHLAICLKVRGKDSPLHQAFPCTWEAPRSWCPVSGVWLVDWLVGWLGGCVGGWLAGGLAGAAIDLKLILGGLGG